LYLPQESVTFIYSDADNSRIERAAAYETLNGEIHCDKGFLCNLIGMVAIAQDAIAEAVDPGCVALDDLAKSRLIACL
jgi:hypothetical protein